MADSEMTETEDYDKSADPTAHASSHESGGSDEINVLPLIHPSDCLACLSTNQLIPTASATLLEFDTLLWDRNNDFNTTLHRFTAPSAGKYQILLIVYGSSIDDNVFFRSYLFKNSVNTVVIYNFGQAGESMSIILNSVLDLDASDYLEFKVNQYSVLSKNISSDPKFTRLHITKLY